MQHLCYQNFDQDSCLVIREISILGLVNASLSKDCLEFRYKYVINIENNPQALLFLLGAVK